MLTIAAGHIASTTLSAIHFCECISIQLCKGRLAFFGVIFVTATDFFTKDDISEALFCGIVPFCSRRARIRHGNRSTAHHVVFTIATRILTVATTSHLLYFRGRKTSSKVYNYVGIRIYLSAATSGVVLAVTTLSTHHVVLAVLTHSSIVLAVLASILAIFTIATSVVGHLVYFILRFFVIT